MRKFYFIFLIFTGTSIIGQTLINDTTIELSRGNRIEYIRNPWAFQFDCGPAYFVYDKKTSDWLGNHRGFLFRFEVERDKIFIAIDFRPFTINPKKDLIINNQLIPQKAKLNPIKVDLMAGYRYDLFRKTSLNGYLGWMNSLFYVINEKELGKTFDIPSQSGLILGFGINEYFELSPYFYNVLFLNYNLNVSNYSKLNNQLGDIFHGFEIGIAFKIWVREKNVEPLNSSPFWPY